eukprot:scaffold712_cov404-Prasinococcus_capsulatus_cf.AAC.2
MESAENSHRYSTFSSGGRWLFPGLWASLNVMPFPGRVSQTGPLSWEVACAQARHSGGGWLMARWVSAPKQWESRLRRRRCGRTRKRSAGGESGAGRRGRGG